MRIKNPHIFFVLSITILTSCASFYNLTFEVNEQIEVNNYALAEKLLDNHKKFKKKKNILLYYLNKGYLLRQQNKFAESNTYFNKADLHIEDQGTKAGQEALALITNDAVRDYKASGFEKLMVHYYKALNYLALSQNNDALIEVRRMDIMIQNVTSKSKKVNKKMPEEIAFIQNIMGLVYETSGDYNNAFIAYRNAYDNYKSSSMLVPSQLKQDILHATKIMGFGSDLLFYQKEFGMQYDDSLYAGKQAVVFWENGLGPVKEEWSLNFHITGGSGQVFFANDDLGLNIPFTVSTSNQNKLVDLGLTRIAMPKYEKRINAYDNGTINFGGKNYQLEVMQDINHLAFTTHKTEMMRTLSKTLLRFALKKIAELELAKENEALGTLAMIGNAVSEKADTRNWQSLPATISYTRIPVTTTDSIAKLNISGANGQAYINLPVDTQTNKKLQLIFHHSAKSFGKAH